MTIYILELYGTAHKERHHCDIAGYYTNKAELVKQLKKHIEEIGEIWSTAQGVNSLEEHAKTNFRYFDSELANITVAETNEWTA